VIVDSTAAHRRRRTTTKLLVIHCHQLQVCLSGTQNLFTYYLLVYLLLIDLHSPLLRHLLFPVFDSVCVFVCLSVFFPQFCKICPQIGVYPGFRHLGFGWTHLKTANKAHLNYNPIMFFKPLVIKYLFALNVF